MKAFVWLLLDKYKCILPRKQLYNIYVWKKHFKICLNPRNYINIAVNFELEFYIILWSEQHEGRQRKNVSCRIYVSTTMWYGQRMNCLQYSYTWH